MTDSLRARIAAAIQQSLLDQSKGKQYATTYTEMDDEGNEVGPTLLRIDGTITPAVVADAVIAALGLRTETTYAWKNKRSYPTATRYATRWETDETH